MQKTLSPTRTSPPREEVMSVIQKHIHSFFGVSFRDISEKKQDRPHAKRRIVDARTAYIHAIYNSGLMDGKQIGEHLGIAHQSVYHHLRKYDELRSNGTFGPLYDRFNEVVANDIAAWQRRKLSV